MQEMEKGKEGLGIDECKHFAFCCWNYVKKDSAVDIPMKWCYDFERNWCFWKSIFKMKITN